MTAILFCFLAGLLLFVGELFFPSAIFALLAGIAFLTGILLAFSLFGWKTGLASLAAGLFVFGGLLWAWLRFLPKSRIGHRMALEFRNPPGTIGPSSDLVGRQGILLSPCHPIGVALFEKKRTEVVAESGFLEEGSKVRVVGCRDGHWIVEELSED
ncbi:MAG: NfeD family protein [Methylacidiphilaceae bacterium]|nr:NfeD family protein [Candidatus Methylacidiphilaceae bacterium]